MGNKKDNKPKPKKDPYPVNPDGKEYATKSDSTKNKKN